MAIMETITAIFNAAKTAWTAASTWQKIQMVATAITIGTGIKGYQTAKALQAKGQDILGQKTAQGGKIPVIYGRRRVGSTVAFMNTADKRSKDLFVVYALSVGEVDQIELDSIEINGVSIKDSAVFRQGYYAGSDKISSGAGSLCTASQIGTVQNSNGGTSGTDPTKRYRMVFNAHHGADDQTADPMLTASISTQWTSNHRLRGIAYLACSFEYDTRGMFRSIPQLTVIVRGKKVYDPRLDGSISGGSGSHRLGTPSTYEWSDNAVLCTLDYITNDNYGKGLSASDLNLQSFQTAADISDELEDTPDYSGSYAAATFSTISGQREITVDETTWIQAKASGVLNLKDSGATSVFADCVVVGGYRFEPFDGDIQHRLILDCSASSTYTDESGTALVQVKRFHCNGVIDTNQNVLENTRELLANMRGILNYIDGKYEITLEDTASSAFTVTDDHIISSSGVIVSYENKANKYNKVVVQFFNEKKKYEMDTVTVFHDATPNYKSDDGGEELELVVDFPHIINPYVAYNMGEAILGRSRNQQTISFTAVPELYKVKVGDVITVVYTPLGYTGKLFRVEAMSLEPNGLVNIQAIEYLDIYTWEAPPQEVIEDYTYIPQGFEVSAPTGLTFTDSNTSATGRPFLSWNEPTDFAFHEYRINIVDSSSNKLMNRIVDVNFVDLTYLPKGSNYVASVSSINSVGSESDAATLTFTIGDQPVNTNDIQTGAVTTVKINDLAITTAKLVDDAITNAKIAVDAIQGDVIAAGAITTTKIGANAVTTAKLANDAVTSDIIAAGAITATEISDGAISTPKLAAGAVTTAKLAAGSVTSNEIFANTITAGNIASGAINTDELAANAVTAAKIAANTITASEIASGTITATQIATGTLTSASGVFGAISANDITTGTLNASNVSVINLNADNISTGTLNADLLQIDGVTLDTDINGNLIIASGGVGSTQLATNAVTSTKITNAAVTTAKLVDAAITTVKIAADAVTNAKIAVNAIQGDVIAAGAITETKITDSAVSTNKLAANAVTAAKIAAGTITATQIAADTITAANIAAGAIATSELAANAVTAAKIAANTITAGQIATGTITSNEIAAGTIVAADIASNTITASQIATGTLTSASGVFGTISASDVTTGTLNATNVSVINLNADNISTGTLNANRIQIDNITLDTDGSGNLIIKTAGVDTAQLATDAVETAKIAAKAVSSFTVATGGVGTWFTDNLSETDIVTTSVFQAPTNTDNDFAVLGNTTVVANSGSSTDFVQLRLYRRSASTSGGVSSASYVQIASYKMYGDSGEAIQTIADSDSYTADYYYQYKMTLQTQGTSQIGGQTRSYGTSLLQVFVTYR